VQLPGSAPYSTDSVAFASVTSAQGQLGVDEALDLLRGLRGGLADREAGRDLDRARGDRLGLRVGAHLAERLHGLAEGHGLAVVLGLAGHDDEGQGDGDEQRAVQANVHGEVLRGRAVRHSASSVPARETPCERAVRAPSAPIVKRRSHLP
jgi:hypothetical protein